MSGLGVTLLVTTHYLDEAEHCHRIALIHAGRPVALGTTAELKEVFAGRAVLEVTCALRRGVGDPGAGGLGVGSHGLRDRHPSRRARPRGRASARAGSLANGAHDPISVERIVPSLEDVFIHTIQRAEAERR
ncbi:MAG: hypothetical protein R3E12_11965 [Candidatus Eisenbacteria bacterium]